MPPRHAATGPQPAGGFYAAATLTPDEPAASLARSATARGQAALASGDVAMALRWLERAHRLVPSDPNVMLSLASLCLNHDPGRAERLFRLVAEAHDISHAWLGLAAAQLRLNGPEAAELALATALSRFALVPDATELAAQIGCVPNGPGWCCVTSAGRLEVHPAGAARIDVRLDGQVLHGASLPLDWTRRRRIEVLIDGRPALGSPIRIDAIGRVSGCVEASDAGLSGWAWHPADPDRPVTLTVRCRTTGRSMTLQAATEVAVPHTGPLARPRSFAATRTALTEAFGPEPGLLSVAGPDGADLLGSPLAPHAEHLHLREAARWLAQLHPVQPPDKEVHPAFSGSPILRADAPMPSEPVGADDRQRPTAVVIPVHNGAAVTLPCLDSVLAATPAGTPIIVVDDGSTDPELTSALDELARGCRIRLLRHATALGFPASVNAGIAAARTRRPNSGHDVVLLNSDTLVPPGWLDRLRAAAYSARDIGSVTPLSNAASILSYPGDAGTNPRPNQAATNQLDRLAQRANGSDVVDIPVGVGFCLYIRRDCLDAVGLLRPELFAQGYGEENDFCLRARRLGWRSVALTGLFVGHHGGGSFKGAAQHLRTRNAAILERAHPGHDGLIADFIARDPLAQARRRIDLLRWRAAGRGAATSVLLITHNDGGGVERRIAQSVAAHRAEGRRPIVLRPAERGVVVGDGYPNLVYALPDELPDLLRLLRSARLSSIEVHHFLDHDPAIYRLISSLGLPYDVHVHDYGWFCPRLSLVGTHDRYCGEPDLVDCEICVADLGHFLNEEISVAALRARSNDFLANARRVITPSDDTRTRIRRHFPTLLPETIAHQDDDSVAAQPPQAALQTRVRVCVVGAIGVHKGYGVLLDCARDAQRRDLNLEFVVAGRTIDDERLLSTGRVFVTGGYSAEEAVALIAAQRAQLGFVPSIWPETWCLGLGELWGAGLNAAAFDIGAPAERIRRSGRGIVLPLGLSASAINNALIVAGGAARYG